MTNPSIDGMRVDGMLRHGFVPMTDDPARCVVGFGPGLACHRPASDPVHLLSTGSWHPSNDDRLAAEMRRLKVESAIEDAIGRRRADTEGLTMDEIRQALAAVIARVNGRR